MVAGGGSICPWVPVEAGRHQDVNSKLANKNKQILTRNERINYLCHVDYVIVTAKKKNEQKTQTEWCSGKNIKRRRNRKQKSCARLWLLFITMSRRNDQSGNDNEPNQPIMSTTAAAKENDVRDSDFTHSSENESEEQTVNKAAASSVEDDRPEQAAVVTAATEEDDPVSIYKDVNYINFSATGQASIGQLLKEAMVRQGYDCF